MVEKNATPILNNLPIRYKIKEIHHFNDDKILCNLLQEKKQSLISDFVQMCFFFNNELTF